MINIRHYNIYFPIFIFFLLCTAAGAQNTEAGALQIYQTGRDLEARNRMTEADQYYNEAIRICQNEVASNAATSETYTIITWALYRQSKFSDAVIWGERGLRLYSNEFRIVETMGAAWFYLGDFRRSLSFFQRYTNAIPQGERSSTAFFFIGEIYRLSQMYHHADIAYTTAVRLNPGNPLWWYRLATVREMVGDIPQAIEAYQQAIRFDPNYQNAIIGLLRLGVE